MTRNACDGKAVRPLSLTYILSCVIITTQRLLRIGGVFKMANIENDLFISYSSKDKDFVQKLVHDLKTNGINVWWDEWEMKVGDSLIKKIQDGIKRSAYLGIVLSPNSVTSPWVEKELDTAQIIELEKQEVFILPILKETTEIPIFLKMKNYADFRGSYENGLNRLLERFESALDPNIIRGLMCQNRTKILSSNLKIPDSKRDKYFNFLIEKLSGTSAEEKLSAIVALFVLKYKDLPNFLVRFLNDPSITIRRNSVFYLGELRYKPALEAINGLISSGNPDIRATARDAFKKISGRKP